MGAVDVLRVDRHTLYSFLDEASYSIPDMQRPFAWGVQEAEDLIEDIDQARAEKSRAYFVGNVIYYPEGNDVRMIVDGQQRMASFLLLLTAARNYLEDSVAENGKLIHNKFQCVTGDQKSIDWIRSRIRAAIATDGDTIWRLTLRDADRERLKFVMDRKKGPKKFGQGRPNLYRVAEYFEAELYRRANSPEKVSQLADFILNHVVLTSTETHDILGAYTIFTTMNARGKDVSLADLLRAEILHRCQKLNASSSDILDQLTSLGDLKYDDQPTLVRRYWIARTGKKESMGTARRLMIKEIQKFSNGAEVLQFATEVGAFAESKTFIDGLAENAGASAAQSRLAWLGASGFQQHLPTVFAAFTPGSHPSDKELDAFLDVVERIHVLHNVAWGGNPSELEDMFAVSANLVYDGGGELSKATAHLIQEFGKIAKDDQKNAKEVAKMLMSVDVGKSSGFILRRLEVVQRGSKQEIQLKPPKFLHVEHILPQKPKKDEWPDKWQEEQRRSQYVGLIGNITLLGEDLNNKAKNLSYKKKILMYSKSDIELTKAIPKAYKNWDLPQIKDRCSHLSAKAASLWHWKY